MMKKSRNRRRRTAKLTTKDISKCKYFMNIGKKMNAHKVELKFSESQQNYWFCCIHRGCSTQADCYPMA